MLVFIFLTHNFSWVSLDKINNNNNEKGEYYLTDVIEILACEK